MSHIINVFRRELHRMTSRRIYLVACVVLPLFCVVFMATVFGSGEMNNLPVGVVDADNTATSRHIVRLVEATPALRVAKHYANETEAHADVQRKRIYGYLSIPSGFEEKVGGGREVTLCYYYHYALLGVGGEIYATFEGLLKNLAATPVVTKAVALGVGEERITSFLMPVVQEEYPVYNSVRNYSVYLTLPFFFVMLQILLLLVTTFALGSEGKEGTFAEWLHTAGGDIGVAVLGKLLPYTFIFILMSLLANGVFFGVMKMPLPCSLWAINAVTVLFVLATQALALFLFSVCPALGVIISVVSMIGSLGATLSGVTFPVAFMDAPVRAASYLFPVRHFVEAVQVLLYGNGSYADVWRSLVALLLFLLPSIAMLPRLKNALISHKYDTLE